MILCIHYRRKTLIRQVAGSNPTGKLLPGSIRVQYRPLSWTLLGPNIEEVEQFLALLRFEQNDQVEMLSEVLK